jgi:hypothetical protein
MTGNSGMLNLLLFYVHSFRLNVFLSSVVQVSERDDRLLAETMQNLGDANAEVDGDRDSEDEEDTGMGEVDVEGGSGIQE